MKTILLALLVLPFVASAHNSFAFDLNWMKVRAKTKEERTKIAETGAVIETIQDDYVTVLARLEEKSALDKMGIVEVSFPVDAELQKQMFDFPNEDSNFHNYDEITKAILDLQNKNSDIVHVYSIGKSVEGRELINIMITNDPANELNKPAIIFLGTHHAREHLSTEMPLMLAQYLAQEYRKGNKDIRRLVETRVIHIIPMVNPDGVEWDISDGRYKMWRKNRTRNQNGTFGVDLNRNYAYGWGGPGSSGNPSSDTYRGTSPFSEPETLAVKNFIESRNNITTLLSYHTFSKLILYPYGHTYDPIPDTNDRRVHEVMAQTMAQWNGYTPQKSSELYLASGDTTDWSYGTRKIISFTFELDPGSMFEGGFYPGQSYIPIVFQKNINPALYLIELSDNPYRVLQPLHKQMGLNSPLIQ